MRTATKVSAFALGLVVAFGGAWTVGAAAGPFGANTAPSDDHPGDDQENGSVDQAATGQPDRADRLPGLAATDNGYTLQLSENSVVVGVPTTISFRILDEQAAPITSYAVEHEKRLHLILVRRDGTGYQHVHPDLAADGMWSTTVTVAAAGTYRLYADFKPEGGTKTTLGADIDAPGQFQPQRVDDPVRTDTVDGYEVTLDGELQAGRSSTVTATITRNGQPVADLQPYLGAYGHLVTLRSADLGYLHVHPLGEPGDGRTRPGPRVQFAVEVPSAGIYRLYLDFQHQEQVRTAEFVLDVTQSNATHTNAPSAPFSAPNQPTSSAPDHGGHGG